VSNYHVFEGAKRWAIKTKAGKTYPVERIIDYDKRMDYLTFKVDMPQSPYLKLSETLPEKGEDIFVLGNPKGLESTVSRGVVSAFRDRYGSNDFIQIDAAISPGSSGSPVMNMQGDVIGIATAKLDKCENCNFAVNIQLVKKGL
jgi:serine protease Do